MTTDPRNLMNWEGVLRTHKQDPSTEWDIAYSNDEREKGQITHVPAGEPAAWSHDGVFYLRLSGQPTSENIGVPRMVANVVRCEPAK